MGDYPFHHIDIDTKPFVEAFDGIDLKKPLIPYLSNVSGTWITNDQAANPTYWVSRILKKKKKKIMILKYVQIQSSTKQDMSHCVRFMDNVVEVKKKAELDGDEPPIWVEIGPGSVLASLVGHILPRSRAVSCLPKLETKNESVLQAVGTLWTYGVPIEWAAIRPHTQATRVVGLPTYPFQCKEYIVHGKSR